MALSLNLPQREFSRDVMAAMLDSTYLALEPGSETRVRELCHQAVEQRFRAVCIRPEWLALAEDLLAGSTVGLATVIAFPEQKSTIESQRQHPTFGVESIEQKCVAIRDALEHGATELDVVVNTAYYWETPEAMAALLSDECRQLVAACEGRLLKLIFECDLFVCEQQQALAFRAAVNAGVGCLKNATGFLNNGVGATPELVRTMKCAAQPTQALVKASGGIRNIESALAMAEAGADIIGSSAALTICDGLA